MTEVDKLGWFWFWREVGERKHLRDLPDDLDDFERFSVASTIRRGTRSSRWGRPLSHRVLKRP